MSSKLEVKPLLAKNNFSSEHSLIANSQPYHSYEQELETNLRIILKRFQNLDSVKVRNLLEELDNNLELAIKILEQEIQSSNRILEEKKLEGKKLPNLSAAEENRILKRSFLNLYKKFVQLNKECEELNKKNDSCKQELQRLKLMNRLLLQGQYSQAQLPQSKDIY